MNTPPTARAAADDAAPTPAAALTSSRASVAESGSESAPASAPASSPVEVSAQVALAAVTEIIDSVVGGLDLRGVSGDVLLATAARVERVGRWVDALRVAAAAEIADQSRPELGSDGLAAQRGCRTANELLQRVTRVCGATAARRLTLGSATRATATLSGYVAPPRFPAVADALAANVLGVDSAFAVVTGLTPVLGRSPQELWGGAEQELVAAAVGTAPETAADSAVDPDVGAARVGGAVVCTPEETKLQAAVWRAVLDPDGVEPAEERAMRKRGFRIGRERDGVVPVSGQLVPVAAAMLTKVFTACMSPRTAPAFLSAEETAAAAAAAATAGEASDPRTRDPRSLDQQRHDILVGIIQNATRSADTPTVGGAPPTVLVTIRERDLRTNTTSTRSHDAPTNLPSTRGHEAPTDKTPATGQNIPADAREATPPVGPDIPADTREATPPVGLDIPADVREATPPVGADLPADTRAAPPPVSSDLPADAREATPPVSSDLPADTRAAPSFGPAASDPAGFVPARAGIGFVEGVQSAVSVATVRQFICAGGIQTVTLNDAGRVISLGSEQRCFTGQQRRAITIRDGGCLIPGCGIPASWCEIHHVAEAAHGGPTHTDNGALLCWFHHRSIDTSGWQIRIRHGVPQVKAPNWIQPNAPWRPATRSPTRLHNALDP